MVPPRDSPRSRGEEGAVPKHSNPSCCPNPRPCTCHGLWVDITTTDHILLWWPQSEIRIGLDPRDPRGLGWASPAGAAAAQPAPPLPVLRCARDGFGPRQRSLGPAVPLSGPPAQGPWHLGRPLWVLPWSFSPGAEGHVAVPLSYSHVQGLPAPQPPAGQSPAPETPPVATEDSPLRRPGDPQLPTHYLSPTQAAWSFLSHLELLTVGARGRVRGTR